MSAPPAEPGSGSPHRRRSPRTTAGAGRGASSPPPPLPGPVGTPRARGGRGGRGEPRRIPEGAPPPPSLVAGARTAVEALVRRRVQEERPHARDTSTRFEWNAGPPPRSVTRSLVSTFTPRPSG